ncbi:MAG: MerR family transcriptional regulator [Emergencia sp.]|nr:MerR family transcriptional regulator [Emergencia sp.]
MKTVKEVSKLTGISIRALHHYDAIGLLKPSQITSAGYRLYDHKALERLQIILLFRELRFPLKEIQQILDSPDFNKGEALSQQIQMLTLQKERLEKLIALALQIQKEGVDHMLNFESFDKKEIDDYAKEVKARWGHTESYRQFMEKSGSAAENAVSQEILTRQMFDIFAEFGALTSQPPGTPEVQALVKKLQDFISRHHYQCSDEILKSLGEMYVCDPRFTKNIDKAGGKGTAEFVKEAIEFYCR